MKYLLYSLTLLFALLSCQPSDQPDAGDSAVLNYREGITRISGDSLAFVLFAPKKQSVYLIGDFNDWQVLETYRLKKSGDYFWIKIGNLIPGKEYICQYLIDKSIRVADPYANKISDPVYDKDISSSVYPNLISYPVGKTTEIAMTVSTQQTEYNWNVRNFEPADSKKLNIYEILIRDFTEQGTIKGVQDKIEYLKSLGINAIELMPFNEFEGNDSWGYNPSFYFATDKAYGTTNDFKTFIDACHTNGIAVIMDIVLNHSYGQSPMVRMYKNGDRVSSENPWYNTLSPNTSYSWGFDFNHESSYTRRFVDSVCAFWMKEYKVDGFRFDFTKGFTNTSGDGQQYDPSRITILKRIADEIRKRKDNAIIIFEHLADNSEERELSDYDILLWGNMNYNTNEATMGWGEESGGGSLKGDLSRASYKQRGWNKPNLIAYMESHDEERIMYKNGLYGKSITGYNVKDLAVGLQRTKAAAVILLSIPGTKMIWQFGELGYDYKLGSSMEEGRLERKPIRWDYYDVAERRSLYDLYSQMFRLRQEKDYFSTENYTVDLINNFKYVTLVNTGKSVVSMANFDVTVLSKSVNFGKSSTWIEYFSGTEITTDSENKTITLLPGEFRLYIEK
ncbi:MAG: alpha-amylase family glycosyl hydrolase [Bacteroidales bacterium]|nr:alpha-amylase family glycosyl hydrolase [Bacteroidales bacterium]